MVLKENQAYQDYREQRVNVGRQGLLDEGIEGSPEPQDKRAIVETRGTLEPWDQGVHLVKREIQEPPRS